MRKLTNNENEILLWASRRQAHPVERSPYHPDGEPAQLSFVLGQAPEANDALRPIEWPRFFAQFHLMGLMLAYDDGAFELLKLEDAESPVPGNAA